MNIKVLLFLMLICFLNFNCYAQSIKYNYALSGLNLREKSTLNSKVLVKIPYAGKVIILKKTNIPLTVENIKSTWLKVKYHKFQGYVFGGYLSSLPAPDKSKINRKWKGMSFVEYNKKYLLSKGIIKNLNKNEYELKTIYIIENISVLEGFLLFRLLGTYSMVGIVDLPVKDNKYRVKPRAIDVSIDVKRDSDMTLKFVKIELIHYQSSGSNTFIIEKNGSNGVKITEEIALP